MQLSPQSEMIIRLGFFIGIFAAMACWEIMAPRRPLTVNKFQRWLSNILIVVINSLLLRFIFPITAVGIALLAQQHHWGLLNHFIINLWLAVAVAFVLLDLAIYGQHVMFHYVPLFWRFHRMHHVDLDYDVTTGLRFHPLEIIVSMLIKFAVIVLLGAPALAVVIFEVVLNATSLFNHGNVYLPKTLDKIIRVIIVTPDMHRVHHSQIPQETNANFGFNFSCWDRLFKTYRAQPQLGHDNMVIGLPNIRQAKDCIQLPGMLRLPFKDYS